MPWASSHFIHSGHFSLTVETMLLTDALICGTVRVSTAATTAVRLTTVKSRLIPLSSLPRGGRLLFPNTRKSRFSNPFIGTLNINATISPTITGRKKSNTCPITRNTELRFISAAKRPTPKAIYKIVFWELLSICPPCPVKTHRPMPAPPRRSPRPQGAQPNCISAPQHQD